MYNLNLVIRAVCTIVTFGVFASLYWKGSESKEHASLQAIISFLFIHNLILVFDLRCQSMETALLVQQLRGVSIYCFMVMMMRFTVIYTGIRMNKIVSGILFLWGIVANAGVLFLMKKENVFFSEIEIVSNNGYLELEYTLGFWGLLFDLLLAMYAFLILKRAIMYYGERAKGKDEQLRKNIFLITVIGPTVVYILYFFHVHRVYELNMIATTVAGYILTYASNKYRVFDVVKDTKDAMLENLEAGILIYDAEYRLVYANKLGTALRENVESEFRANAKERIALEDAEKYKAIVKYGQHEYEVMGNTVFYDGAVYGYNFYIVDVTEKNLQLLELQEAKRSAEEANAAKSNFLANVSHDLRTPLNGIIGISELILKTNLKTENRFRVNSVVNSARNLLVFINNLLDLSKIESGELEFSEESYSIEQVVYESMQMINMSLGERPVRLEAQIAQNVPSRLIGDRMRVQHILHNLMGNAIKYTNEGEVKVSVYGEEQGDTFELHMDVQDTGSGIPSDKLEDIFLKYHQGNWGEGSRVTGTGLGLSIAKDFAIRMGGDITVESEVGKGSVFQIVLKQKIDERTAVSHPLLTSEMLNAGIGEEYLEKKSHFIYPGANVLVVDDINTNLIVTQGLLEPYQLKLKCVDSADAAIQEVKTRKEPYDLIFMDYMMPIKDGVEAVAEIRKWEIDLGTWTPIIAMTADVTSGMKEFFTENGFSGYLSKPVEEEKLDYILAEHLQKYKKINAEWTLDARNTDMRVLLDAGIDTATGLKNNGGKASNYCRVLSAYEKEMSVMLPTLKKMLYQEAGTFTVKVHGIKSGSYAIGAKKAGKLAEKLELELKEAARLGVIPSERYEEKLFELEKEIYKMLDVIRIFIEKEERRKEESHRIEEEQEEQGIVSNSVIHTDEWWEKIEKALNGYDAIRIEHLLDEAEKGATEDEVKFLQEMKDNILVYEYAVCKKLVTEYKEKKG